MCRALTEDMNERAAVKKASSKNIAYGKMSIVLSETYRVLELSKIEQPMEGLQATLKIACEQT